ncbi:MAG: geranylgeranylglyceryl phosphate synthase family protein [Paludibacteraceae bacterium]|nr:geranylgeranylglyceryl phosphate synthase family protein [Paludibacteraceae bacterium]
MEVLNRIISSRSEGRKQLALLLDPEKADLSRLSLSPEALPDYIFVGGSTGGDTTDFVRTLKSTINSQLSTINYTQLSTLNSQLSTLPILLFPGSAEQLTDEADALLYLSLLSGNNPEYLVGQQIRAARQVRQSGIEAIPTAYILIDGGTETSAMRVTGTQPIPPEDINRIVDTAIAAEMMGKQLIYLEAGSGAVNPVSEEIIRAVRGATAIPLVVGGGIRTPEQMKRAHAAGADIVVIGNHFESHPEELTAFCQNTPNNQNNQIIPNDEKFMRLALLEAEKAFAAGEVPVGCLIVSQGQIIGRGHNLTETLHDVTAHAEIQAVTAAAQTLGAKYMPDATLYVTVEPCVMCAGAIGWSQIKRVVYGCTDDKRGFTRFAPHALHAKCTVTSGILETECRQLMQQFFKQRR